MRYDRGRGHGFLKRAGSVRRFFDRVQVSELQCFVTVNEAGLFHEPMTVVKRRSTRAPSDLQKKRFVALEKRAGVPSRRRGRIATVLICSNMLRVV